jgi:hypothetical protein
MVDCSSILQRFDDSGTTSSGASAFLTELAESELSELELVEGRRLAAARHASCVMSSTTSLYAVLADANGPDALTDPLGCPAPARYARCDSSSSSSSPGPSSALAEIIDLPGLGVELPGVESPVLSPESSVVVRAWHSQHGVVYALYLPPWSASWLTRSGLSNIGSCC